MRVFLLACAAPALLLAAARAETPEELIGRLKDPEPRARRLAAEALGKQKVEAAAPALAELLRDSDAGVRGAAADALGRIGPKAVPALVAALRHPEAPGRLLALTALRRMAPKTKEARSEGVVKALAAALRDKDADVRIHAAAALGAVGADAGPALPALFEAAKDTANVGPVIRSGLPSSVADAAVAAALKIDPGCTAALAAAALPGLTEALKSKDMAVLQAAGFALAQFGPQAQPAVPALREARKHATGFAEMAIDSALEAAGDASPAAELVKDRSAPLEKRLRALSKLGWSDTPDEKAVGVLAEVLNDPEPRIRAGAVDALRSLGPKAKPAVPKLLELLGDEELETAAARAFTGARDVVPDALAHVGAEAVPGLVGVLKDAKQKPRVRLGAVKALGKMGRKARAALPALEAGMEDRLALIAIESACAYALAGGDPAKALPVVREGLAHDSPYVLWASARAAERLGPKARKAAPDLRALLKHKEREVRIVAARALSRMGPAARPAVPAMAELLRDKDLRQRYHVAQALVDMGPDAREALPVLIERLKDLEPMAPNPTLLALGNLGPDAAPALPALRKLLESGDSVFVGDVLNAIGQIGPGAKEAVPQVAKRLEAESQFDRAAAARALGLIGPEARAAVTALKKRLGDERKNVRVWAAFALARITGESKPQVALLIELWNEERGPFGSDLARYDVAQALELLGAEAAPARDLLLKAVLDEKTAAGTRAHAARALGHLPGDADVIVPKLVKLLGRKAEGYRRKDNCRDACEALGLLGPKAKAAVPALRRLLEDDENEVAEMAARALEKIEAK